MPRNKREYVCPRCFYATNLKYRMKRHFEELKTPCPNTGGIELTEEVKHEVLLNHVYTINVEEMRPQIPEQTHVARDTISLRGAINPICKLSQTFNTYQTINNIVSGMESMEKIKMITDHQGIRHIDFEDRLEKDFQSRLEKLEQDGYKGGYCLNHDGLLKLVDGATKMDDNDLNQFNILFDKTVNRVKILSCGKWDSYLEELGVKEVIRLLKSYFLDSYELYLIKHLHGHDNTKNRFSIRNHLDIYYKFLGTFDLDAIVCTQTDKMILGYELKENNEYYLANHYGKIYKDIKTEIKISEKNKVKRTITNIIKENSTHNLNKLNKIMLDLVKTDHEFLDQLIEKRQLPTNFSN